MDTIICCVPFSEGALGSGADLGLPAVPTASRGCASASAPFVAILRRLMMRVRVSAAAPQRQYSCREYAVDEFAVVPIWIQYMIALFVQ